VSDWTHANLDVHAAAGLYRELRLLECTEDRRSLIPSTQVVASHLLHPEQVPTLHRWYAFISSNYLRRRRQEQDRRPAVQTMTVEEMTAAARKLGKNPEAWLKDAEQRGIKVVSEKS